jgi:hypothetical protein
MSDVSSTLPGLAPVSTANHSRSLSPPTQQGHCATQKVSPLPTYVAAVPPGAAPAHSRSPLPSPISTRSTKGPSSFYEHISPSPIPATPAQSPGPPSTNPPPISKDAEASKHVNAGAITQ